MSDSKTLVRMGILAFFTTIVFHFASKMRDEVMKTYQPQLPRH